MLTATGNDRPGAPRSGWGKYAALIAALFAAFPWASLAGLAPGIALIVYGAVILGASGVLLILTGVLLATIGWLAVVGLRLTKKLTADVPANLFGVCRGLGADPDHPGFTDWLSDQIDEVAGLPQGARPLRFGHLWTGGTDLGGADVVGIDPADRHIDLRMISTCLSQGRPYELPWQARTFFYDPQTWRTLFPNYVVDALLKAPPPMPPPTAGDADEWRWEERVAAAHTPALVRLPEPGFLPVIVATRMSLSFPLLISAVPLWAINRGSPQTQQTTQAFREAVANQTEPPAEGLEFSKLWFTDGGLCSNFPVHLFDAALASRPTFAINLGPFPPGRAASADQTQNVEYARSNRSGLLPPYFPIPERGFGAVAGFTSAAINTARNWQDSSHLDFPGFRDRIVRVLQTRYEGGLNLYMDGPTIDQLADRGRTAGQVMVEQFTQPRYPTGAPTATGWDNHRWVRYRALLSCLPAWLISYGRGRRALDIDPVSPPSYNLSAKGRELALNLTEALDNAADVIATADPDALTDLTETPRPQGMIGRIPQT
jgi:hypothetical protein